MAYRGWLQLGSNEIANSARVVSYMRNGIKNSSTEIVTDDSWPLLPVWLGRTQVWDTPATDDDCPWFDYSQPASGQFAGVWPLRVDGLDSTPLERETMEGAVAGGGFGVKRTPPRKIEVEAVLVASTPAGLQYGLAWLGAALRGENCSDDEAPRRLQFLESAPPVVPEATPDETRAAGDERLRMIADVALTEAIKVDETFSPWSEEHRGACCAKVTFTLTAGVPWVWRNPIPLVANIRPRQGVAMRTIFENVGPGGVLARCDTDNDLLVDPAAAPLSELPRPVSPNATIGIQPLASLRSQWVLNAGRLPIWSETLPTVTVQTGPQPERSLRFQWVTGIVGNSDDLACRSVGEAIVTYVPANAYLTLDAVTGRATVVTAGGEELDATPVTTGRWGGPWRPPVLRCSQAYTLVVDALTTVHPNVTVSVEGMVRR